MALSLTRMKKKAGSLLKLEFVNGNTTVANDMYIQAMLSWQIVVVMYCNTWNPVITVVDDLA